MESLLRSKLSLLFLFLFIASVSLGEIYLVKNDRYCFSISPEVRTSVVTLENNVDLNRKNDEDSSTYLALFYGIDLDIAFQEEGPEFFASFERNGPWYCDAPIWADDFVLTSVNPLKPYRGEALLPTLNEYWLDVPLLQWPLRFRGGLFVKDFGGGYAVGTGYYENYGFSLYHSGDDWSLGFYYFKPDLAHKIFLGPQIEQEKEQEIDYQPNTANFFAIDALISLGKHQIEPYVSVLVDHTSSSKRSSGFSTPTDEDFLGTVGIAWNCDVEKWSLSAEVAKNFGAAQSQDPLNEDIKHQGYFLQAGASYTFSAITPNVGFIFASGNKALQEGIDFENGTIEGDENNAFSIYSPFNYNLADSISPRTDQKPLLAMGSGYGLDYGVNRPTTLQDPGVFENLIMPSLGVDYQVTEKFSVNVTGWYLLSVEKGIGSFEGVARKLSRELGQEIDVSLVYEVNEKLSFYLYFGYFFPGEYYRAHRDDVDGNILTPFVRGDGEADGAYHIELVAEMQF